MKIRDGYITRPMGDLYVVVDVTADVDFNGLITLNESALFIWELLQNEISYDDLLKALYEHYDAPVEVLKADLDSFIENARKANLIEEKA